MVGLARKGDLLAWLDSTADTMEKFLLVLKR